MRLLPTSFWTIFLFLGIIQDNEKLYVRDGEDATQIHRCAKPNYVLSYDGKECIKEKDCETVVVTIGDTRLCSCGEASQFVAANNKSCVADCEGPWSVWEEYGGIKYCHHECPANATCYYGSALIPLSDSDSACDILNHRYWNSDTQKCEYCPSTKFISRESGKCVSACADLLYNELENNVKVCCSATQDQTCKCPERYYYDTEQNTCLCKELHDPVTDTCVSRAACLFSGKYMLGHLCLQYNGCQTLTANPHCLDRNQLVQCGNILCPRSVGCSGVNTCDVYDDNYSCSDNCKDSTCAYKNVTYFNITNNGYAWFTEQSYKMHVCLKDTGTTEDAEETRCKSTYYVFSEKNQIKVSSSKHKKSLKVTQLQLCPSTVGCVNNAKSHIFSQGLEKSNVCAAASALVECNQFCKTKCVRNAKKAGVFQLVYSTSSGEQVGAQIGPLQEWYCPKGKEKRKTFIDPWLWGIIGVLIALVVIGIVVLAVVCICKQNWRLGTRSDTKKCNVNCNVLKCCKKSKANQKSERMKGTQESPVAKRVAKLGPGNKELEQGIL